MDNSISIKSEDYALMTCLRALAYLVAGEGPKGFSAVKGTSKVEWQKDKKYTFRFVEQEQKEKFLQEAKRLFPSNLWQQI